ncbi:hypothetical protein [Deinococcus aquatilis]|uniref:hypothetical protein n=1 Tax=Deinococcus aquatilis TaxID=519440 RepID=UPI00036D779E|nr:hypothetical protein [Deinococcus aquatilis]
MTTLALFDAQLCGEQAPPTCLTTPLSSPDLHLVLQVLHRIEVSLLVEPFQIARLPHEWRALLIQLYGGHVLDTYDLEHAEIILLDELHQTFAWDAELERPVSRAFNLPDSALCQVMQDRGLAREGLGWLFLHPTPLELAPTDQPAFERHVQRWQARWGSTGDTLRAWARWMDWQHTLTRVHRLSAPTDPT